MTSVQIDLPNVYRWLGSNGLRHSIVLSFIFHWMGWRVFFSRLISGRAFTTTMILLLALVLAILEHLVHLDITDFTKHLNRNLDEISLLIRNINKFLTKKRHANITMTINLNNWNKQK